jgi:cytochrome c2
MIILLFVVSILRCTSKEGSHGNNSSSDSNAILDSSRIKDLANNYREGKQSFQKLCDGCHVAPERHVTDQYLFDNLFERLPAPAEDYFIKFIQDSRLLTSSGDQYSKRLHKIWNQDYEHHFRDSLSQQDFHNLIIYIKVAAKQK